MVEQGTYYRAISTTGEELLNTIPSSFIDALSESSMDSKKSQLVISSSKIPYRVAKRSLEGMTITVLSTEGRYVSSLKLFNRAVQISLIGIRPIIQLRSDLLKKYETHNEDLIHNLTSLNTYSIQNLFSLIPQDLLTSNINEQHREVQKIIEANPKDSVKTLLKEIKYAISTRVEISVFERIKTKAVSGKKESHQIHKVILSILQIFIEDFDEKNITVYLDASEKLLSIDYDALCVSLFYLFENSIKYCCPRTDYKIVLKEEKEHFSIQLCMVSIRIEEDEVEKLFIRGYRSELAKNVNENGEGIGMNRILKTLSYNDAELEIIPRAFNFERLSKGNQYEGNVFKVKFKSQQDWFKT